MCTEAQSDRSMLCHMAPAWSSAELDCPLVPPAEPAVALPGWPVIVSRPVEALVTGAQSRALRTSAHRPRPQARSRRPSTLKRGSHHGRRPRRLQAYNARSEALGAEVHVGAARAAALRGAGALEVHVLLDVAHAAGQLGAGLLAAEEVGWGGWRLGAAARVRVRRHRAGGGACWQGGSWPRPQVA